MAVHLFPRSTEENPFEKARQADASLSVTLEARVRVIIKVYPKEFEWRMAGKYLANSVSGLMVMGLPAHDLEFKFLIGILRSSVFKISQNAIFIFNNMVHYIFYLHSSI